MATLTFLGAARTVTGSKHLLEVDGQRILFDCGLFQGLKELRLRNWAPLPVPPETIDAVVLTHAHLDHSGWLPRLVGAGLQGPDLLHRRHARSVQARAARRGAPAGRGREVRQQARLLASIIRRCRSTPKRTPPKRCRDSGRAPFGKKIEVGTGIDVEFINAGHLLGSSYVLVTRTRQAAAGASCSAAISGRYCRPILPDPSPGVEADVLLVESTYGDRLHPAEDDGAALARIIKDTVARRGKVIIPAFAIGRVEELLYWLFRLEDEKRLAELPIYVDSPMALKGIEFYDARTDELDPEIASMRRNAAAVHGGRTPAEESKALVAARRSPAIDHRLERHGHRRPRRAPPVRRPARPAQHRAVRRLPGGRAPAAGSLIDGAQHVKMFGQQVPVHARIEKINGMSAHADAGEIVRWLRTFPRAPKMTYLVHGEAGAAGGAEGAHHERARLEGRDPRARPESRPAAVSTDTIDTALPARTDRRRRRRPAVCRRLRQADAQGEDAGLAPLPGRDRRPRHLLRPAPSP